MALSFRKPRRTGARVTPVSRSLRMNPVKKARIFAAMQKLWDRQPAMGDSGKIIENDRSR